MKKKSFLLLILAFTSLNPKLGYALEWKRLHEEANKNNLPGVLSAVKNKPYSIQDLYLLGLLYLNLYNTKDAQQVFSKIISLDPKITEARWGLAEISRRRHELDLSEKLLNDVIKSNPNFSPAYISLSYIKYSKRDFKNSLNLATKVMQQGRDKVDLSNYVRAYLLIAGAKGMLAHSGGPISKVTYGRAVMPNLRKAQALKPNAPEVLFGLGSYYFLAPSIIGGNIDKAKDYLERSIKSDPNFSDAYVRLAQYYKIKGNNQKYQMYLDNALEIDPGNELAIDILSGKCDFICK